MPTAPASRTTSSHAGLVSVDGRTYPLASIEIQAHAQGGIAQSTLVQHFRNPHTEPLELVYTAALPADGAVLGYEIVVGDTRIRGEVRRREEALQEYRDALFDGRLASLIEQDRDDTFSQRLGSVPPGVDVRVELHILHPLAAVVAGTDEPPRWEYRFPTVTGVRYHGAPGRVPDRERIDPDRDAGGGIPTRMGLSLEVGDGAPEALRPQSPTHAILVERGGTGTRVVLEESSRLDRDLVLRWTACGHEPGLSLVEGRGLAGDGGRYALLTITPPATPTASRPRDLTLLLDASGSMRGAPLAAAQRIAIALLRSLGAEDRFEVLVFSNDVRRLTRGLTAAGERAISQAMAAIGTLTAAGGTEMRRAIGEALDSAREGAQRQVVLVTDGLIGFEREIVAEILRRSPLGCRVHVVGVGPAPNRSLTRAASRAGAGVEVLASTEAEAEEAAARLVPATRRPVLTDLTVEGTAVASFAPSHPRDVLAGSPTRLAVHLAEHGGTLHVRGRLAGSAEPWARTLEVSAHAIGTSLPLGALFGREAVADLEMSLAAEAGVHIEEEIEALGLRHRIATRRTSLVAVAETPSVDPRTPRRVEVLPLEVPVGLSAEALGLGARPFEADLLLKDTASAAVSPAGAFEGWEFGLRDREERSRRRRRPQAPEVTVLRARGNELVLELVAPRDGFLLPMDGFTVQHGGEEMEADVVEAESSPRGPHREGRVVRLTLRLPVEQVWRAGEHLVLLWTTAAGELRLRLTVPAQAIALQ